MMRTPVSPSNLLVVASDDLDPDLDIVDPSDRREVMFKVSMSPKYGELLFRDSRTNKACLLIF